MVYKLTSRYQKEIALSLLSVFFISGLGSLKAQLYMSLAYKKPVQIIYTDATVPNNLGLTSRDNDLHMVENSVNYRGQDNTGQAENNVNPDKLPANVKFDKGEIGGPSQPEMTAFKSVGSDNMVSPFSGDFSYNIPLLDVGGYPVNMFYNSGISMDQEASWVGLGWNINPGTITRNMRGLPDDFDGTDLIKKTQTFREDKTFGLTTGASIKIVGFPLTIGASWGLSWNNKLGIAAEAGINAALSASKNSADKKTYSLTASAALNASSRAGASFSPSISLSKQQGQSTSGGLNGSVGVGYTYSSRQGLSSMHLDMNVSKAYYLKGDLEDRTLGSSSGTLSFAYPSIVPSITKPLTHHNYGIDFSMGFEYFSVNPHFKLHGSYSKIYIANEDKITSHPAYGMLHLQAAGNDDNALLDFNRANDGVYTPNTPTIAMPVYTYDVFSINGEGTGGSFRAYRGDIGHMKDPNVKSKEDAFGLGVDLGFANTVHIGADLNYVYSPTESGDWKTNNMASPVFSFQDNKNAYQAVYFKNPGEKTVPDQNFQSAMGGENLIRLKLANTNSANPMLLPKILRYDAFRNLLEEKTVSLGDTKKMNRDKRTQVVSFLDAEETERIGMNKKLYSYNAENAYQNHIIFSANCNTIGIDSFYRDHDVNHQSPPGVLPVQPQYLGGETQPFRHKHHMSEIDVLGTDGKKYVYGLPVYNKKQYNVTFSINQNQKVGDSKATYDPDDASMNNTKGRDWFMEKEEIPPYAHSYLLTELISTNYVDVTGNGITEDDMGDAVKFNYSKYSDFKWRTPVDNLAASYSSGLKTDEKDDKAHYVYGERESWYLYSIESKNMVARFYVKSDRKDGRSVIGEAGGVNSDPTNGMKRLERISLFSKGDLTKFGDNAKPIKTIRFFHSYKLCKNQPASNQLSSNTEVGQGKLTLDSIWITYNGNQRKPKSKYVFYYPADNNPDYNFDQSDRWGTYKPVTDNPNSLPNEEYPYSTQNQTAANKNAAAWTMNKILLPSGAVLKIDYESDSYSYVQDKKAGNMCQVIGFGLNESSLPASTELKKIYANDGTENDHVYIQLPYAITTTGNAGKAELKARYLDDMKLLYMKLSVVMPTGSGLSGIAGEESIPVYADIDVLNNANYGLISSTIAWVKVKDIGTGHTPMVQTVLQFLTNLLPGKAYKAYDLSEEGNNLKSVIMAMGGMISSVGSMFKGEMDALKSDLKCQQIVPVKSFARLINPTRNKLGGGLRVRRIVISDSWDKMTGQRKSTYGQEYNYTTTELINGKLEPISSGVASWEPSIGGDENPHRGIMRFMDHNKGGPYDFGAIETPLGEMFYPSPMVGYSKVEIVSIHRDTVKNLPTRKVTEFYTTKDFPYKSSCTELSGDANARYEPSKILQLLRIDMMKGIAQSQGFIVETNDMNGKEKSQATYTAVNPVEPISYVRNYYNTRQATENTSTFNHNFQVIDKADGKVSTAIIGRDVEIMTDFRQHHSETYTANLSINFDAFIVGFFPIPLTNLLQPVTREGTMYRSAAVLKLVTHYGVLDSVVVIEKGSMVSTKNLVYDAETGNPLLTRTQNEHNKPIYNFNYPAHWAYSGMGPAYRNIDATFTGLKFTHGILTNGFSEIFDNLESGDEIYTVSKKDGINGQTYVPPCDDEVNITPANAAWNSLVKNPANRIWAVSMAKVGGAANQWVFMDADGNPYNAVDASIRIVRSGKRNMLDQSVAAITSLNSPIVNNQLVLNDATGIIQTSSATFKDNWRVDNNFYRVREVVDSYAYAKVHRADLSPEGFYNVRWKHEWREFHGTNYQADLNKDINQDPNMPLFKSTDDYKQHGNWYKWEDRRAAFLLYNYNSLPTGINLYKGLLSVYSHSNYPLFTGSSYPSAHHPGLHGVSNSQNSRSRLAYVNALNRDWYSSVDPMIDNYFRPGSAYLSYGTGLVDYASGNSWDNYIDGNPDKRINVSLPLLTNGGSILASQRKVGFKLKLDVDDPEIGNGSVFFRCFWSSKALGGCYTRSSGTNVSAASACAFATPKLSYYYYKWGDVDPQYGYPNDPAVNVLMTKFIRTVTSVYCKSKFDRKAMNPYVEGVLGNWRLDSTYVYYGKRNETDPAVTQIDTRTAGTINGYKSFWTLPATPVIPNTIVYLARNQQATDVWVWNSTITQYNRKGYEIENTDPLGRFNSGLYGYNQQLPVALGNNSRVRELLFDGYEDYDYKTASANCINCLPHRQFNYTTSINSQIDGTQHHTGNYSLRVNPNQSIKIEAPITSLADADDPYGLKIQNKTISYTNEVLGTNGTAGPGLQANWYNHAVTGYHTLPVLEPAPSTSYPQAALIYQTNDALPRVPYNEGISPVTGVTPEYFSVKWVGKIQAPTTGNFRFKTIADNGCRVKIGTTVLSSTAAWNSQLGTGNGNETTQSIGLTVGEVYDIEISFYNQWGPYQFDILWNYSNGVLHNGGFFAYASIPRTYLYPPNATSFQHVITSQQSCYRLDSSQVTGHALTDSFSLIQGKKMLLSCWVKVGTANCCFPESYNTGNNIALTFFKPDGSVTTTPPFVPTGPVIEGWQRYESVFDVSPQAIRFTVSFNNTSSTNNVYFDDIRIHPFNANVKSYVYSSSNLRLMAELDENNYGSLYEYDDDGTLARVKKETHLGIKTINETRSATQKKITEQ